MDAVSYYCVSEVQRLELTNLNKVAAWVELRFCNLTNWGGKITQGGGRESSVLG